MSANLIQLLSTKNINYITKNPSITFFKNKPKKIDNIFLTTETYKNNDEIIDFNKSKTFIISNNSDIIKYIYIKISIPQIIIPKYGKFAWVEKLGFAIIKSIDLIIEDKKICSITSKYIDIYNQLYNNYNINELIGNIKVLSDYNSNDKPSYDLIIPLDFWFNKNSLLQYTYTNYIKFNLTLENINNLIIKNDFITNDFIKNIKIENCEFISTNINITNNQKNNLSNNQIFERIFCSEPETITSNKNVKIDNNQPIKEFHWVIVNNNWSNNIFLGYTINSWDSEILNISKKILLRSIYISDNNKDYKGSWELFLPNTTTNSINNKINIINDSLKNIYLNTSSIIQNNNNNLTNKIQANILINNSEQIIITYINSNITIEDISIPITSKTIDTRVPYSDLSIENKYLLGDVYCNIFSNYTNVLDKSKSIIKSSELIIDNVSRIKKQKEYYFNFYIPYTYYPACPDIGINTYTFTTNPNLSYDKQLLRGFLNIKENQTCNLIININEELINGTLYLFTNTYSNLLNGTLV